jgi:hypothetical protein
MQITKKDFNRLWKSAGKINKTGNNEPIFFYDKIQTWTQIACNTRAYNPIVEGSCYPELTKSRALRYLKEHIFYAINNNGMGYKGSNYTARRMTGLGCLGGRFNYREWKLMFLQKPIRIDFERIKGYVCECCLVHKSTLK